MPRPRKNKINIAEELSNKVTSEKISKASKDIEKQTTRKRRSTAWKGLEYSIAEAFKKAGFLKSKRVPKQDQMTAMSSGKELPDVYVPEAPFLQLDGKYSEKSWDKVEKLFLECQAKYELKPQDRFAMVTQKANSRTRIAHITLEFLAELCSKAYLGGKTSENWVCPRCRSEQLTTRQIGLGQELTHCETCTLEFVTKDGTRPIPPETC